MQPSPIPATAQPPGDHSGDSTFIAQSVLVLRRRWKIAFSVFALTIGITAANTLSQPKLYRPQATLEIRPERSTVSTMDDSPQYEETFLYESYFRTQQHILSSPGIAEATIKALPPSLRERYQGPGGIQAFARNVDLEQVRASFLLRVGFPDPDPEAATQIANTLVSVYVDDVNRRARELKSTAADTLTKETLPDIRKAVAAAETALATFQADSGFVEFSEKYNGYLDSWKKANVRLTDVRLSRFKLAAEHAALADYGSDGASGLFNPSLQKTKALEQFAQERARIAAQIAIEVQHLKESHPRLQDLRAQLSDLESKIREAVQGALLALQKELKAAEVEEKSVDEEVKRLEGRMAETATALNKYKRLQEELAASKDLYALYIKRQGESTATAGVGLQSVRLRDAAKPPTEPWKPNTRQALILGALFGLLLAGASTLVAEQLDNRILSPDEVRAFVGMDVLAAVPRLKGAGGEGVFVLDEGASIPDMEAFRALRAQVVTRLERMGKPEGRAWVLSVLSPLPGEGKTTVAANLARVLALEGRRVLLFDADLRKPRLHSLLKSSDGPGLGDVLSGKADVKSAARASAIEGVDIVGVRAGTSSAAELASSPRFAEALRQARDTYDFVILDSAPVIQASESALIARRADAAVLVVREAKTRRSAAFAAKEALLEMGVSVLGAVLNAAEPRRGGYGYGYGYGSFNYPHLDLEAYIPA
ncbi:MAG: polysaccharide biosynthesis tyrosine autokinase [Planctomycetia bacterium]|nr:polysaccharide biosynthesis tyrosine autokinase [Planctomycetia bacterium]